MGNPVKNCGKLLIFRQNVCKKKLVGFSSNKNENTIQWFITKPLQLINLSWRFLVLKIPNERFHQKFDLLLGLKFLG